MHTYYSILSIAINHTLQERIGIGMVLVDGDKTYFRYSEDKLSFLKGLLSADKLAFAKSYLRNLQTEVDAVINNMDEVMSTTVPWSSSSYISYLNKYANNLLLFTEPKALDLSITPDVFDKLFSKWVFSTRVDLEIVQSPSIQDRVKERLYPKIDKHVNLDIVLTQDEFPELFLPVEVNFIGKNGAQVIGQAVDFNKGNYHLQYDLTRFTTLIKAVESVEKHEGTYFIIGQEPDKQSPKNHQLWSQVLDSSIFRFVDIDETPLIESFITENGVEPYFESIE